MLCTPKDLALVYTLVPRHSLFSFELSCSTCYIFIDRGESVFQLRNQIWMTHSCSLSKLQSAFLSPLPQGVTSGTIFLILANIMAIIWATMLQSAQVVLLWTSDVSIAVKAAWSWVQIHQLALKFSQSKVLVTAGWQCNCVGRVICHSLLFTCGSDDGRFCLNIADSELWKETILDK